MILLLIVTTLLVGTGVLVLLHRPTWSAPLASSLAAMMLMATVTGLLGAVTRD
ncbi:hypothetical protein ACIPD2_40250 [Streptomyces griseofuscus]|uniref:hypothetical protein n=1 Tax=Streptomyces griseofuscus TaxID=146922 RepID=UPI0037F119CC